jgi:hypothetical protein
MPGEALLGNVYRTAFVFVNRFNQYREGERCGWEFFRVRESAFYIDKNAALKQLWFMLEERGILPGSNFKGQHAEQLRPPGITTQIRDEAAPSAPLARGPDVASPPPAAAESGRRSAAGGSPVLALT